MKEIGLEGQMRGVVPDVSLGDTTEGLLPNADELYWKARIYIEGSDLKQDFGIRLLLAMVLANLLR